MQFEMELADSEFGSPSKGVWELTQTWVMEPGAVIKVRISYDEANLDYSEAVAHLLNAETGNLSGVSATAYPSRWHDALAGVELETFHQSTGPEVLIELAQELAERIAKILKAQIGAARR